MSHQHGRARVGCSSAKLCVEHIAAQRHRMVRQIAVAGPWCRHLALFVHQAHPGQPVAAELERIDAEQRQFAEGPRGECVATRLVPGCRTLLDERDVVARSGEPGRDGRSGGTTADDEDVGVQGACRQPADAGEPGIASGPIGVISAPPIVGASGEV